MPQKTKKISEFKVSSILAAFDALLKWSGREDDNNSLWFRGVNNSKFDLVPGAYRKKQYNEYNPLLDFVQEGRAFEEIGELNQWKTYYLAQHTGIPTRLLDWSESFSAALFFALDGWKGKSTPCVWVMRPEILNALTTKWSGLISPEQNNELEIWLPNNIRQGAKVTSSADGQATYDSSLPIAIYPRKGNRRMIAQQGTFTVHGTKRVKLNELIEEMSPNPANVLCKISLDGLTYGSAMEQLETFGIKRHTIYPDLVNYVAYLREIYGW